MMLKLELQSMLEGIRSVIDYGQIPTTGGFKILLERLEAARCKSEWLAAYNDVVLTIEAFEGERQETHLRVSLMTSNPLCLTAEWTEAKPLPCPRYQVNSSPTLSRDARAAAVAAAQSGSS